MKKLILVRHAERPEIRGNEAGLDVLLTEQGKQDTQLFARRLQGNIVSIKTSSIGRCVQTAEIIAAETGYSLDEIKHCKLLGNPGFIIASGSLAWKQWQEKGHSAVNEHLLSATQSLPGFVDFTEALNTFTQAIIDAFQTSSNGTHIWVTHDTMLATLASRTSKVPLSLSEWPNFLGHVIITLDEQDELAFEYHQ